MSRDVEDSGFTLKAEDEPHSQPLPVPSLPQPPVFHIWSGRRVSSVAFCRFLVSWKATASILCLDSQRFLEDWTSRGTIAKARFHWLIICPPAPTLYKAEEDDKSMFYLPQLLSRLFPPWGRIRNSLHHIVYQPGFLLQRETASWRIEMILPQADRHLVSLSSCWEVFMSRLCCKT